MNCVSSVRIANSFLTIDPLESSRPLCNPSMTIMGLQGFRRGSKGIAPLPIPCNTPPRQGGLLFLRLCVLCDPALALASPPSAQSKITSILLIMSISPFFRPCVSRRQFSDSVRSVRSASSVYFPSSVQNAQKSMHHDKPRHFTSTLLLYNELVSSQAVGQLKTSALHPAYPLPIPTQFDSTIRTPHTTPRNRASHKQRLLGQTGTPQSRMPPNRKYATHPPRPALALTVTPP